MKRLQRRSRGHRRESRAVHQTQAQNRGKGTPTKVDESNNSHKAEMDVIDRVKSDLRAGDLVVLQWTIDLSPGKAQVDQAMFASGKRLVMKAGQVVFNNLARREGLQT
ncbi:hypothetical protein [Paenarthrobacter sp. NPDC018779]|uniref:hypothetical protein n=1 Tax=Paenarthrobacter sp. NPDC018779 TaxID=3364375 RepID=UPI0037C9D780